MANSKKIAYKDLLKLKKTFSKESTDRNKLALSLIDEAFFCGKTLEKLKEKVDEYGVITEMSQGEYKIDRENPALKSYNTTIKNYQILIKQINDLLPLNSPKPDADDGFAEFNKE